MSRGDGHGFWAEGREEELGSGEMIGIVPGLKQEQRGVGEEKSERDREGEKKNGQKVREK